MYTKRQEHKITFSTQACFCHVCHRSVHFIPTKVEMAKNKSIFFSLSVVKFVLVLARLIGLLLLQSLVDCCSFSRVKTISMRWLLLLLQVKSKCLERYSHTSVGPRKSS